jgi:hypothetical protein
MPTFIVLFGAIVFVHHVIAEQQQVMSDVKNRVWSRAMASCRGASEGVPQPNFTTTMPGAPGSDTSVQPDLGWASEQSAGRSVTVAGSGFTFTQGTSWHATVICNNQTQPGNIAGVGEYVKPVLAGIGQAILSNPGGYLQ